MIFDSFSNSSISTLALASKELGDVLWYLSQIATELDLDLNEVAAQNLEKLFSRMSRNKISGSGDNR